MSDSNFMKHLKTTKIIPVGLVTTAIISAIYLITIVGIMFLRAENVFVQFGGLVVLFSILGMASLWFLMFKAIGLSPGINNTWFFILFFSSLFLYGYIEYGPGGYHVGSVIASLPVYLLERANPALFGVVEELTEGMQSLK